MKLYKKNCNILEKCLFNIFWNLKKLVWDQIYSLVKKSKVFQSVLIRII